MPVTLGRVAIEDVRPSVDGGARAAKAALGVPQQVSAIVIADGHDRLLAWMRHGAPRVSAGSPAAKTPHGWRELPLESAGNDVYRASFVPERIGAWSFEVIGVPDDYGTWLRDLRLRFDDGQDVALELEEGALMAERRAVRTGVGAADRRALAALATALRGRAGPGPGSQRRSGRRRSR